MNEIKITFTLKLPEGAELLDVKTEQLADSEAPEDGSDNGLPARVLDRIHTAPQRYHELLTQFACRCREELGCTVEVPEGKRTDYLNVYRYGRRRKRVASFMVTESNVGRGPRAEIYCHPENAARFDLAEVDLHNGRPVQVKIYLGAPEAIDSAIELVRAAIAEAMD